MMLFTFHLSMFFFHDVFQFLEVIIFGGNLTPTRKLMQDIAVVVIPPRLVSIIFSSIEKFKIEHFPVYGDHGFHRFDHLHRMFCCNPVICHRGPGGSPSGIPSPR